MLHIPQMVGCSGGKAYPIPLTAENNYQPKMEAVFECLKADGYDENKVRAFNYQLSEQSFRGVCNS